MKKNLFYLFALICSMSLFIACSDDDPDYSTAIDGEIVGNYKGTLNVTVQGTFGKGYSTKNICSKGRSCCYQSFFERFQFYGYTSG